MQLRLVRHEQHELAPALLDVLHGQVVARSPGEPSRESLTVAPASAGAHREEVLERPARPAVTEDRMQALALSFELRSGGTAIWTRVVSDVSVDAWATRALDEAAFVLPPARQFALHRHALTVPPARQEMRCSRSTRPLFNEKTRTRP